jgi:hypothetical protein
MMRTGTACQSEDAGKGSPGGKGYGAGKGSSKG